MIDNLDELLKIPLSAQDGKVYNLLSSRKKELFSIFFDKTKSVNERNAVFDEANKLAKYLNESVLKWKASEKKSGYSGKSYTTSKEARQKNCDELIAYLKDSGCWDGMSPFEQGQVLAQAWGTVKQ